MNFLAIFKKKDSINKDSISYKDKLIEQTFTEDYLFKLECLSQLIGTGSEDISCEFYHTLSDEEKKEIEPYEGLRIYYIVPQINESIILSYNEVLELMEKYKIPYLEKNPDKKDEVEKYIDDFKKNAKLK